ncbi:MAG TPA: ABC transporter ATP-binding protein [Corynebacteriales bacterium]|nr:ABC transporter ATP-binding protein [Mycobacteriales bacterium]
MKRRELAGHLIGVTKPVLWPLFFSSLARIVDQILAIVLLAVGAWGLTTIGSDLAGPSPDATAISHTAGIVFGSMVGIALIKAIMRYLEQFLGHLVAFRALELLRTDFFRKIWPQAPALQHTTKSGDLLARATKDNDRIEVFFAHMWAPAVAAIVVPVTALLWLGFAVNGTLALVIAPFVALAAYVVPFVYSGPAHRAARTMLRVRGDLTQHITDTTQGMREVLGFAYGPRRLAEMDKLSAAAGQAALANRVTSALRRTACEALRLLAVVTTAVVGVGLVRDGVLDIPALSIAITVALGVFSSARGTEDFADDLERSFAAAERMITVKERPPYVSDTGSTMPEGRIDKISFTNVSFSYPGITDTVRDLDPTTPNKDASVGKKTALTDVSLDFAGGKHTAIVGISGSGKSTLVHLLLRHFDPDTGEITINGVPTTTIAPDNLRTEVTEVSQHSHLFNNTVAENLRLANPKATDAELWEALQVAGLDQDIARTPQKLNTRVGEFGTELSGGQVQRLTIARALLTDAKVFVLDEYTSHLNSELADEVSARVKAARPDATFIEITHQPASALLADHIVVMEAGRIVEQGTPAALQQQKDSIFNHLLQRWSSNTCTNT